MNFAWDAANEARLRALVSDGASASEIAAAIGGGLSRSAVIGKIHRLGLGLTRAWGVRNVAPRPPRIVREAREMAPAKLPAPEARRDENGNAITLLDASPRDCRWPHGDPAEPDFHICAQPKAGEGPYCPYHTVRARNRNMSEEQAIAHAEAVKHAADKALARVFG